MRRAAAVAAFTVTTIALIVVSADSEQALGSPTSPTPSPFHPAPAAFGGLACIDSDCLTGGRNVVAKIGDVVCGEATSGMIASDGQPAGYYRIDVAPRDEIIGCGTEDATVRFFIDGREAQQTGVWANGGEDHLDIWAGADISVFSGFAVCSGTPCFFCFSPCPTALVEAYIGGQLCGSMRPSGWLIVNRYGPLVVKSDKTQVGCGAPGATVTFKIDGEDVAGAAEWTPGFQQRSLFAGSEIWGDNDCSGQIDGTDVIRLLQYKSGGPPSPLVCVWQFGNVYLSPGGTQAMWGDIDCSGGVDVLDALKALQVFAQLSIVQNPECPLPGWPVQAVPASV